MIYRKSQEDIKHMISKRPYANLPPELEPYHYYVSDSGHCIMCVLECHVNETNKDEYELPVPVRYVFEKGYRIVNGYVVVEAKYNLPFGLDVDDKYTEF
jgi:hypothetical protein